MSSPTSLQDPMIVPLDKSESELAQFPVTVDENTLEYEVGVETATVIVPLDKAESEIRQYPVTMEKVALEYEVGVTTAIMIDPSEHDYYDGEYVVTPKAYEETVLDTSNKVMKKDVTVLKIPYYETSNVSGGYTVYIADEV